jgi:ribosomal protein S27E
MQPLDINCPECGAPVAFRGTAVSAVCEYCSSTVVRSGVNVELIGKVSALIDNGSPILLHAKGKFSERPSGPGGDNIPFVVSGRLQVQYERGTWNEWFLEFADGTIGWLSDAQNQFAVVRPIDPNQIAGRVPTFDEFQPGVPHRIAGRIGVVVDRRGASYKGAEGLLPFEAEPGMTFYGVDLRGYQGEFITLDWGTDPNHTEPTPYVGRAVSLAEIGLFPLRRFEGWPAPKPPPANAPSSAGA